MNFRRAQFVVRNGVRAGLRIDERYITGGTYNYHSSLLL